VEGWITITQLVSVPTYYDGLTPAPDGTIPPAGTVRSITFVPQEVQVWGDTGGYTVVHNTQTFNIHEIAQGQPIWGFVPVTTTVPQFCDGINGPSNQVCSLKSETIQQWQQVGFSPAALTVVDAQISAIPEPETYAMLLAGLSLMGFVARRRKQQVA
jgi:hypothetical protein